jgi:hypothetical protein
MATELDRPGSFQVRCKDYTLAQFDSGAVGLQMVCRVLAQWDEENKSWIDWVKGEDGTEYDEITVEALIILVKKNDASGKSGGINEKQADALIEHTGWDGSFMSIESKTYEPRDFQLKVEAETYKNKTRFRGAWVNAFDAVPGGGNLAGVSSDVAKRLQDQWGSSLRALASKAKDKAQKPGGKPTLPPKAKAPEAATANTPGGDIPF